MKRITLLRRTFQIISFILIVYLGVIVSQLIAMEVLPPALSAAEFKDATGPALEKDTTGKVELTGGLYGPVKTCRYAQGDAELFQGCALYFISRSLTYLPPIEFILPFIVFLLLAFFIFGRAWCGWICPIGFFSEIINSIRRVLGIGYLTFSPRTNNFLLNVRYGMLTLIVLISLAIFFPAMVPFQKDLLVSSCQLCPVRFIFQFLAGQIPIFFSFDSIIVTLFSIVGMILFLFLISGVLFRKPWCRICPSGAIASFFNKTSLLTKEKDVKKCTKCGICKRICLVQNTHVYDEKESKELNNANCIRCFRCVEHCPEKDCLKVKFLGKTLYSSNIKNR